MKLNEFVNEDDYGAPSKMGDWFRRRGFLGRQSQLQAIGRDLQREKGALSVASLAQAKQSFISGLQNYVMQGVNAGVISFAGVTESSFNNYKKFSKILESTILNEAQFTVAQYVNEYMKKALAPYMPLQPEYATAVADLTNKFQQSFKAPNSKFPTDIAGKLFDLTQAIRQSAEEGQQTQQGQPKQQAQPQTQTTSGGQGAFGQMAQQLGGQQGQTQPQSQTPSDGQDGDKSQSSDTGDSEPAPAPAAAPKAGTQIEMPGTNIKFKYSPQWVTSDGKPASPASEKVLNQLASGVNKADVPAGDLISAKRNLYQNAVGMSAYESKKRKKSNILK